MSTRFELIIKDFTAEGGKFYFIPFSHRCGSTLLCEDLWAAKLGAPSEYFQPRNGYPTHGFVGYRAGSIEDYVNQLLCGAANRIFGFKCTWQQACSFRLNLKNQLGIASNPVFAEVFPGATIIHVRRRDKVLQAISAWRAVTTDVWHAVEGERPPEPVREPEYDFEAILPFFTQAVVEDFLWADALQRLAPDHIAIWYEDYVGQRLQTIEMISRRMGYSLPEGYAPSNRLREMKNDRSAILRSRFIADLEQVNRPYWTDPASTFTAPEF